MAQKEVKLSATRVNTYLQCKWQYWCNYVEHYPRTSNLSFKVGTAAHSALEYAGKLWMKKGKFTKVDKGRILEEYVKCAVKEGVDDIAVQNEIEDLVEKRINDFALGDKILGLEIKFGWDDHLFTGDGVPLIGALDKVIEVNPKTLLIADYKTSRVSPTVDKMRTDIQLSMYDLVASYLWPQYERVILCLDMLRHEVMYTYRTLEEREEFSKYLKLIYDEIVSLTKEDAVPQLNEFCGWCDFNGRCAKYKEVYEASDFKFGDEVAYDNDALYKEWMHIKTTYKILEKRKQVLDMAMLKRIQDGQKNIVSADKEVYIRQNSRKAYDPLIVAEAVPLEVFPRLVNLKKKAVDAYMDENPAVSNRIIASQTVNFTAPFLAVKNAKKEKKGKG